MATRTDITPVFSVGPGLTSLATAAYNQPAGDTITVRVSCELDTGAATTFAVTDTAGNTYTARNKASGGGGLHVAQIFDCINCSGNASNVITVTPTGDTVQKFMLAAQRWTPTATIAFRAQPAAATGTSTAPATAAFAAGDFAVASLHHWDTTPTAGSGWTLDYSNTEVGALYRNDSPGGTYTASATLSASAEWSLVAASYSDGTPPSITDVDTDEAISDGQTGVAITGTNMGAANADRTYALVQGSTAVNLTETGSGNSTSATVSIDVNPGGAGAAGIKYGSANLRCTLTAAGSSGSLAVTVNAPTGIEYVDIVTPDPASQYRLSASPVDLASGDQVHARGLGGGSAPADLVLYSDGTYSMTTPQEFEVRIWDSSDSTYSAWVVQYVSTPLTGKGTTHRLNAWMLH